MDDLFTIILFVVFILAPLLEQLRKKGQPQKPPPQTRRPQPMERSQTEEVATRHDESAAVLVPDDLWAVLTGQQPAPRSEPQTLPAPPAPRRQQPWEVVYIPPEQEEEAAEDEESRFSEDVDVEVVRAERDHERWHVPRRGESLETEPIIVSLETEPLAAHVRHSAFHDKFGDTPAAVVARNEPKFLLVGRGQLQRAIILKEILGTPRGLE